jgi:hypothetical protein
LPAATARKTPARRAFRNASALTSVQGFRDAPPIEKLITSTPSSVAWLIDATVPDCGQAPSAPAVTHAL